jgi:hypothetical protein
MTCVYTITADFVHVEHMEAMARELKFLQQWEWQSQFCDAVAHAHRDCMELTRAMQRLYVEEELDKAVKEEPMTRAEHLAWERGCWKQAQRVADVWVYLFHDPNRHVLRPRQPAGSYG